MTSTQKCVGDLEICKEFVDLRDFYDSTVLSKIYLLFIFVNKRGTRKEQWGGGRVS